MRTKLNHRTEYGSEPVTVVPLTAISDVDLLIGTNGQSSPLDCLVSANCLVSTAVGEQFEQSIEASSLFTLCSSSDPLFPSTIFRVSGVAAFSLGESRRLRVEHAAAAPIKFLSGLCFFGSSSSSLLLSVRPRFNVGRSVNLSSPVDVSCLLLDGGL